MKPHVKYEAAATILAFIGIMVLVSGLMPIINPGFVQVNEKGKNSPTFIVLMGILFSFSILSLSWVLNKEAQRIRQQSEKPAQRTEAPWERKVKWILFGIVALIVLSAFLF
jgi:membrane protease YdiL (CAAX protease family)